MDTVLPFDVLARRERRGDRREGPMTGEIVIFPGVRIERHDLDLSHRFIDSAGRGFDGISDDGRPRKSS